MYELIGIETEKKEETGKFEFRPVGHGMQNIPPVLDAALEAVQVGRCRAGSVL